MVVDFSAFDPRWALQSIVRCDASEIVAGTAPHLPPFLALEAVTQTCGLHLRSVHDFRIRVVVARISMLPVPSDLGHDSLLIHATLLGETAAAGSYAVRINEGPACTVIMGKESLDGSDHIFKKRFQCLLTTPFSTT